VNVSAASQHPAKNPARKSGDLKPFPVEIWDRE
jgi:hypothetical protein